MGQNSPPHTASSSPRLATVAPQTQHREHKQPQTLHFEGRAHMSAAGEHGYVWAPVAGSPEAGSVLWWEALPA